METKEKVWIWVLEFVQVLTNHLPDLENLDILDIL